MSKGMKISLAVAFALVCALGAAFYFLEIQYGFLAQKNSADAQAGPLMLTETWVRLESPTFIFDGYELRHEATEPLLCAGCYQFTFSFLSRQAGLGNRRGQALAQVIMPHKIVITVVDGKVISAVADGIFDEISGEYLVRE